MSPIEPMSEELIKEMLKSRHGIARFANQSEADAWVSAGSVFPPKMLIVGEYALYEQLTKAIDLVDVTFSEDANLDNPSVFMDFVLNFKKKCRESIFNELFNK